MACHLPIYSSAVRSLWDAAMSTQWIYFFGEKSGKDIKIGRTGNPDLRAYLRKINNDQTTSDSYVILAGVRGEPNNETTAKRHFAKANRTDKGSRTEYFWPVDELAEYVNWLRSQHFTTVDGTEPRDELPVIEPGFWLPDGKSKRIARPEDEPGRLVQDYDAVPGPLAGTAWAWMINPLSSIQDYYTPPEIVVAAADGMGGLDLDAAGHFIAYRTHRAALGFEYDYFHRNRSAFDNPWRGRVWLNPPYGDNAPWFECIERYVVSGEVEQICMLSPMWAFITQIARPVIDLSSALVLLSPTPSFWGNSDPRKTGRNDPHGVLYIGNTPERFVAAFGNLGIPLQIRSDLIREKLAV